MKLEYDVKVILRFNRKHRSVCIFLLKTVQPVQTKSRTALFLPLRLHQRLFWKYAGQSQARFQTC